MKESRQAMAKLGLRAVSGVFGVTMKALNIDLLVVEKPKVFQHPQQVQCGPWVGFLLVIIFFLAGGGETGW